jgi:hypothetical protein
MKVKFSALFPISEGRLILRSPVNTVNCNDRRIEKVIKGASLIDIEALKSANLPLTINCEENNEIRIEGIKDSVEAINDMLSTLRKIHIRSFQFTHFKTFIDRPMNSALIQRDPFSYFQVFERHPNFISGSELGGRDKNF